MFENLPIGLLFSAIGVLIGGPSVWVEDLAAREKTFKTQCSVCYQIVPGKKGIGPNLLGVAGRPAGTLADFRYSEANKNSGLTWDAATLDRYLAAPRQVVPGTIMTYAGLRVCPKSSNRGGWPNPNRPISGNPA